mgnify:FL=1
MILKKSNLVLSLDVVHPHRSNTGNKQRAKQSFAQVRGAENKPFAEEVETGNEERAVRNAVHSRVRQIVRSVEANNGNRCSPGTERAVAQRSHLVRFVVIYPAGQRKVTEVALDAVENTNCRNEQHPFGKQTAWDRNHDDDYKFLEHEFKGPLKLGQDFWDLGVWDRGQTL